MACSRTISFFFVAFLLIFLSHIVSSQNIVETLPGYPGNLPFKLETGYIGVGEEDEVQLFYYFIESERNSVTDPLVLWLAGGPGCSGFSALAFEIGPLIFDAESYNGTVVNGSVPSLKLNPYSWTRVASIIFIDAPVGTGFSYATTENATYTSDTISANSTYNFLRKWLYTHPQFLGNQLYIGGDSYSGITVPILVTDILKGNEDGLKPKLNLQGYVLGNPQTDYLIDDNSRIPYAYRINLISDEYYEDAKLFCNGDYVTVESNNSLCISALESVKECLVQIKLTQILEPQCIFSSVKPKELSWDVKSQEAFTQEYLNVNKLPELRCRERAYTLSYIYMNNIEVQDALYVRQGTFESWSRCVKTFPNYTENINSTVEYHKNLTRTGLRALIYSGDQDITVPYIGTLEWIRSLEVPVFNQWRPWYVDGQVAGYQVKYMNYNYQLTYATLKGAGNPGPEYKPKQSQEMVDRFFAGYPI